MKIRQDLFMQSMSLAPASKSRDDPRLCRYRWSKKIKYENDRPSTPITELDTGIHHMYRRCAELLGPENAKEAFKKDLNRKRRKS